MWFVKKKKLVCICNCVYVTGQAREKLFHGELINVLEVGQQETCRCSTRGHVRITPRAVERDCGRRSRHSFPVSPWWLHLSRRSRLWRSCTRHDPPTRGRSPGRSVAPTIPELKQEYRWLGVSWARTAHKDLQVDTTNNQDQPASGTRRRYS